MLALTFFNLLLDCTGIKRAIAFKLIVVILETKVQFYGHLWCIAACASNISGMMMKALCSFGDRVVSLSFFLNLIEGDP